MIMIFLVFFCISFNFVLSSEKFSNDLIEYNHYIYNPFDMFFKENEVLDPMDISELDKKLLILLESPTSWYNQRGKKVLLLFNETQFPEEFVILRKSGLRFSAGNKFESDFQILEEEEERERYINNLYNTGKEDILLHGIKDVVDPNILDDKEIEGDIGVRQYRDFSLVKINDTISEDIEKVKYKMRIKRLLNMKENVLRRIQQIGFEISNLEKLFIKDCDNTECEFCLDCQSNLNKKYIERNKLKNRFKMIIRLLKEFVEHSNKFILEEDVTNGDENNRFDVDKKQLYHTRKQRIIKRPGYNITREVSTNNPNNNYLELKEMLNKLEQEVNNEEKTSSSNEYEYCEKCRDLLNECTNKELKELLKKKDEIKTLIKSVEFFLESLFERSCPRCSDNSFNEFNRFSELMDTQLKVFHYYKDAKNKLERDIKACMDSLKNRAIQLSDIIRPSTNNAEFYYPENEYSQYLNKIYNQYRKYNKSYSEFEKNLFDNFTYKRHKNLECSSNNLILMNLYNKEIIRNIVSLEIEKRTLMKSKECKYCSYNNCKTCIDNLKLLKTVEDKIQTESEWFNAISTYLQLCNFDETLYYRIFDNYKRKEPYYYEKNEFLWSIEKYSSESFIKEVITSKDLSLVNKANILEKAKLTLETIIKIMEFFLLDAGKIECKNCKKNECNDCFKNIIKIKDTNYAMMNYEKLLKFVNCKLDSYFDKVSKKHPGSKIGMNFKKLISIKANDLLYWKPIEFKIMLECNKEIYSQAYLYYTEIIENKRYLNQKMNYFLETIFNDSFVTSEYHFIDLMKQWNLIWKEKKYNEELLILINDYLSSCIKKNFELNKDFHETLFKKSEIKELYKIFQNQSERINYLINKLNKIHHCNHRECNTAEYLDCENHIVLKNEIMNNLNEEFQHFERIRRKLNSFIYQEHYNNFIYNKKGKYFKNSKKLIYNFGNKRLPPSYTTRKHKVKKDTIDNITIEEYKVKSPIPGMKKYLHPDKTKYNVHCHKGIRMKPDNEYQCSKIEILILQEIVSLLSQNQNRLYLIIELLEIHCQVKSCFECKLKGIYNDILNKEQAFLKKVLNKSSEQLDQCLLDTTEYSVTKLDIIEFQNSINKYLNEKSYFNNAMSMKIKNIESYNCSEKEIQQLLTLKKELLNKVYLWTEELLIQIRKLNDEEKNRISRFILTVYKFIQLHNYSKVIEDKINECINLVNAMFDHNQYQVLSKE